MIFYDFSIPGKRNFKKLCYFHDHGGKIITIFESINKIQDNLERDIPPLHRWPVLF